MIGEIRVVDGKMHRTASYLRHIDQVVVTVYVSKVNDDPIELAVEIRHQDKRRSEPPWLNQAGFDAIIELMTYAAADSTAAWS